MGDSKNAQAPAIEDVDEERDADDIVAGGTEHALDERCSDVP